MKSLKNKGDILPQLSVNRSPALMTLARLNVLDHELQTLIPTKDIHI